jgi:hypothetical protein
VIASPPVGGFRSPTKRIVGATVYVIGLVVGAILMALTLHTAASIAAIPLPMVGATAAAAVFIRAFPTRRRILGSRWRVPRRWGQFGHVPYAAVFGFSLGTGILTALPSAGYYSVLAWGVTAQAWERIWPVFLSFALARAVPMIVSSIESRRGGVYPSPHRFDALASSMSRIESGLLVAIATVTFTS